MAKQNTNVTSAFSLFGKSYDIVMRNRTNFAILMILPFLASLSSTANRRTRSGETQLWEDFNFFNTTAPAYNVIGVVSIGLIAFLLIVFVVLLVQAMLYALQLEGAQGKTPTLKHLFDKGKKYLLRLLGLSLMIMLYIIGFTLVGAIPIVLLKNALGFAVGIIWFIGAAIFIIQRYFLSPYVMIDKDLPVLETMETSAKMAKNHAGAIWSVIGVTILLGFSGIIPILGPIVSFVLGALYSVAPALRYEELKKLG